MIRVVVVHPQRLYRECLAEAIRKHSNFKVVAEVGEGSAAMFAGGEFAPDLMLVDGAGSASRELMRELIEDPRVPKVIAFGVPADDRAIVACAEAGVAGFLSCDCALHDLGESLAAAFRGELRCPRISGALLRAASDHGESDVADGALDDVMTQREGEVVALIQEGMSNKEIARELIVSVSTVKHHVHSILRKFKVRRRGQITARPRS